MRITLIRHAQALTNIQPELIGGYQPSVPLTDLGKNQAIQLRERIKELSYLRLIDGVISSSPAIRAIHTCEIVLDGNKDYQIDPRLRELGQGDWENQLREAIYTSEMRQIIDVSRGTFRPPRGESQIDTADRMEDWLLSLPSHSHSLAFSHGMAINCLVQRLIGFPPGTAHIHQLSNTGITELRKGSAGWSLVRHNDFSHLRG